MARPRKNNLDYFSHDNNMRNDRKIKALRAKYGLEGYAAFNMLLETLSENDYLIIELSDKEIDLLAGDFNIDTEKLTEIIDYLLYLEIFKKKENYIYCPNLDERAETVFDKRKVNIDSLRKKNGVNVTKTTVNVTESTQSKVKESKVNKRKENNKEKLKIIFDEFRKLYPGTKRGLETEFKIIQKQKDYRDVIPKLPEIIKNHIAHRKKLKQQGKFVPEWKNLQTWLNQRCWEDVMPDINEYKPQPTYVNPEILKRFE